MKAREAFFLFALICALGFATASSQQHESIASPMTAGLSGVPDRASVGLALPALGMLQDQTPPVQPAPEKKDVDVTVKTETHTWAVSPVWIAIGILAAVVLLLLIGMAVRGASSREGGTTVVHE